MKKSNNLLKELKKDLKKKINEQFTGYNEQNMAPLTGTCSEPAATINSPEELAQMIGYNPSTGPNNLPDGYNAEMLGPLNLSNLRMAVFGEYAGPGVLKIHSSVWELIDPAGSPVNPFEGYGWASPLASQGVAMEPQIPDGYYNSDAAANYNPQYVFITNTQGGLPIGGGIGLCQYSQPDAFCLQYGYGHTGYCPAPPSTDPGVAPTTPTGMVTGMPGGKPEPPNKGPISPSQAGGMARKPRMPRRGMMREQVERMKKLANIKKKK